MRGLEVLRINPHCQRTSQPGDPISALYRVFGVSRRLARCKCQKPCSHGFISVVSIRFEEPFPKPMDQEANCDYHLRVYLWMVGECLAKGVPPPELSEACLDYDVTKVQTSNISTVLSLIGRSLLSQ